MLPSFRRLLAWIWPIRIALGALLLYSAVPKLQDLAGTVRSVEQYAILPGPLAVAYGYALPFAELAIGLLLVLGLFTRLAAAGGGLMMVSFLIAIGINLARGSAPECGCFGAGEGSPVNWSALFGSAWVGGIFDTVLGSAALDWTTFIRDVVLLVLLACVLLDREHLVSLDRWILEPSGEPSGSRDRT